MPGGPQCGDSGSEPGTVTRLAERPALTGRRKNSDVKDRNTPHAAASRQSTTPPGRGVSIASRQGRESSVKVRMSPEYWYPESPPSDVDEPSLQSNSVTGQADSGSQPAAFTRAT